MILEHPASLLLEPEATPQLTDVAIGLLTGGLKFGAKTAANLTTQAIGAMGRNITQM